MSIDTCGFTSGGVYSETYGNAELQNLCNLFASYGMFPDAPNVDIRIVNIEMFYKRLREI